MFSRPLRTSSLFALALLTAALTAPGQAQIKKVPINRTSADSGASMYFSYCASCHGADGKGTGPVASALTKEIPDLTLLSKNNNGEYPSAGVLVTLGRIHGSGPHGNSDMPVWGDVFRGSGSNEADVQMRLYNITRFIEGMQVPAPKKFKIAKPDTASGKIASIPPSSGSGMYAAMCASCHGPQGIGDGPAAASLKMKPTDLTILSKQNNGEFPTAKVAYILGNMPGTAAHGSSSMPIWGDTFRTVESNQAVVKLRITNLVDYVKSLQR